MMSSEKEPENYDFDAVLGKRGGRYYFYISELQVIAEGETVESAYQEMLRKKSERIDELRQAGRLEDLPAPGKMFREPGFDRRGFGMFALKSLVVGFILMLLVTFAGNTAGNMIASGVTSGKFYVNRLPLELLNRMEDEIIRLAQEDASPEEQEELRRSLRILVNRLEPYADEIKVLFEGDAEEPDKVGALDK